MTAQPSGSTLIHEAAVLERYAKAARSVEPSLCCSVQYPASLLEVIPEEVLVKDYGCGDPTRFVRPGERVLDLGSGAGKACFIAAQIVGPRGQVIGVDCNPEMLAVARRNAPRVAERLGYDNVSFRYGLIQDLGLDLELLQETLRQEPVQDIAGYLQLRQVEERLRRQQPMIADNSIDCVVSNCVLNLVRPQDRKQLFQEIFRVLRPGGRAAISDIVSSQDVTPDIQNDPQLWAGCIAGAFREDRFMEAFEEAGFHGIQLVDRQQLPWRVVAGIEFRSMTVLAYKPMAGTQGPRTERIIYKGPFRQVIDDQGHTFLRGKPTSVDRLTYERLATEPYQGMFEPAGCEASTPTSTATCSGPAPHASSSPEPSAQVNAPQTVPLQLSQLTNHHRGSCCCE
jgi:arsenite methyltransferase